LTNANPALKGWAILDCKESARPIVEECSKPEEADDIAAHYRSILTKIRQQMEAQP
jgi:hypothetical protein